MKSKHTRGTNESKSASQLACIQRRFHDPTSINKSTYPRAPRRLARSLLPREPKLPRWQPQSNAKQHSTDVSLPVRRSAATPEAHVCTTTTPKTRKTRGTTTLCTTHTANKSSEIATDSNPNQQHRKTREVQSHAMMRNDGHENGRHGASRHVYTANRVKRS